MAGEVLDPFAVSEFFVDGFDDYSIKDGLLRCVGYRLQRDRGETVRIAVMRIVMPACALQKVIERATTAESIQEVSPDEAPPTNLVN